MNASETLAAVSWLVGFPCFSSRLNESQLVFLASAAK
jgi:hypothetical protein